MDIIIRFWPPPRETSLHGQACRPRHSPSFTPLVTYLYHTYAYIEHTELYRTSRTIEQDKIVNPKGLSCENRGCMACLRGVILEEKGQCLPAPFTNRPFTGTQLYYRYTSALSLTLDITAKTLHLMIVQHLTTNGRHAVMIHPCT